MIVTLTANPSVDRTVTLAGPLERGGVHRAVSVTSQSAGKGVNISRAALAAGVETVAVFPADEATFFVRDLRADGIACSPQQPAGAIRVNLTVTEPDGTTTKINTPGATAEQATLDALAAAVTALAAEARWVVLAGSLPPGVPDSWYADLAAVLADSPARVAVDTSDAPLVALAARFETARPALIKPNAEELAQITGHDEAELEGSPALVASAAHELVERGVGAVLVTLGAHGAVLVDGAGAWHATPPPITVASTVGAGDSSLFGYLLGELRGLGPAERLRLAVAYGSAAASLPGTTIPHPEDTTPELVGLAELTTAHN